MLRTYQIEISISEDSRRASKLQEEYRQILSQLDQDGISVTDNPTIFNISVRSEEDLVKVWKSIKLAICDYHSEHPFQGYTTINLQTNPGSCITSFILSPLNIDEQIRRLHSENSERHLRELLALESERENLELSIAESIRERLLATQSEASQALQPEYMDSIIRFFHTNEGQLILAFGILFPSQGEFHMIDYFKIALGFTTLLLYFYLLQHSNLVPDVVINTYTRVENAASSVRNFFRTNNQPNAPIFFPAQQTSPSQELGSQMPPSPNNGTSNSSLDGSTPSQNTSSTP